MEKVLITQWMVQQYTKGILHEIVSATFWNMILKIALLNSFAAKQQLIKSGSHIDPSKEQSRHLTNRCKLYPTAYIYPGFQ